MAKQKENSPEVKGEELDYTGVDQGQQEQPALQETATAEAKVKGKKGGKGKLSKKTGQVPNLLKTNRENIRCGFCGNPMTMSKEINVVPVEGKKVPKHTDGGPLYESPGASGKWWLVGVLCDTCKKMGETTARRVDGTSAVDIKYAIGVKRDGSVQMVPVGELPSA